jgi:hypothetical protein
MQGEREREGAGGERERIGGRGYGMLRVGCNEV